MLVARPGQKTNRCICPQTESSTGQLPMIAQGYRYRVHQHNLFFFF